MKQERFYIPERDGITQGLLSMFMQCREKTRIFLKGYSPTTPSSAMTFGSIGHGILERVYKDYLRSQSRITFTKQNIQGHLGTLEDIWKKDNPRASKEALQTLEYSLAMAEVLLPVYFEYWNEDFKKIKWNALESTFKIPYTTRDGRKVFLRGRMDGDFGKKRPWLFETKFKSRISEGDLIDTLTFELQVMLYLWALRIIRKKQPEGVLYNVVRRPGLQQHKKEPLPKFIARCIKDIKSRPEHYFMRFEVSVAPKELDKWEGELDDMVIDFLNWWEGESCHYRNTSQCINKYGRCPCLPICSAGNYRYFTKRKSVFRELEDY